MYEDCILKKNLLSLEECKELSDFFIDKIDTHEPVRGVRGYGNNRLRFFAIDLNNRKTEWFEKVAKYRDSIRKAFDVPEGEDIYSWISIFIAPCDLPMHIDPPVKDKIRILALLQKPDEGAEVVISSKIYGEKTVIPLEVGDAYRLPAHKYYHGVTYMGDKQRPRVVMGFDYKVG